MRVLEKVLILFELPFNNEFMRSNHQTMSLISPNFLHEFFSVWAFSKRKKLLLSLPVQKEILSIYFLLSTYCINLFHFINLFRFIDLFHLTNFILFNFVPPISFHQDPMKFLHSVNDPLFSNCMDLAIRRL